MAAIIDSKEVAVIIKVLKTVNKRMHLNDITNTYINFIDLQIELTPDQYEHLKSAINKLIK